MASQKIVEGWLKEAEEDFQFASHNLADSEVTAFSRICFHFQQAAEKWLKAFIIAHKLEFKRIHDLEELLKICQVQDPIFTQLKAACLFLNDFYIDTRYPAIWPIGRQRQEAERAKEAAQKIGDFVKARLG